LHKSVLELLGVKAGDQLEFIEYGQGVVLPRSIAHNIRALKGVVPKPAKSISVETMNLAMSAVPCAPTRTEPSVCAAPV
jgi:bifunctional DNA-binding transcriptional regulator/antitoxin component of YhaV-PrlF toxin-antitoxin module